MKTIVNRKSLVNALKAAKSTLQFENCVLAAKHNSLVVYHFDRDWTVAVECGATTARPGSLTVNRGLLLDLVKGLDSDSLELGFAKDKKAWYLVVNGHSRIVVAKAERIVALPKGPKVEIGSLDIAKLKAIAEMASVAVKGGRSLNPLLHKGQIWAADGFRITATPFSWPSHKPWTMPVAALQVLTRLPNPLYAQQFKDDAWIVGDGWWLGFALDSQNWARLVDTMDIIAQPTLTIPLPELKEAVKIVAQKGCASVHLEAAQGELHLSASGIYPGIYGDPEWSVETSTPAYGELDTIDLNPAYLQAALKMLGGPLVKVGVKDQAVSFSIDGEQPIVVMAMHISR